MAQFTDRLNIEKIDPLAVPEVGDDINDRLDTLDDILMLDQQGTTLPTPGLTDQRRFSQPPTQGEPEQYRNILVDRGDSWSSVSPPAAGSLTSVHIANNSIPVARKASLEVHHFTPGSNFEIASGSSLIWYQDPLGFVYIEGVIILKNAVDPRVLVSAHAPNAPPPPEIQQSFYITKEGKDVVPSFAGVFVFPGEDGRSWDNARIVVDYPIGQHCGLNMVKYYAGAG